MMEDSDGNRQDNNPKCKFYSLTHVSPTESAWSSFALIINKARFPHFRKLKVPNLKSWSLQYLKRQRGSFQLPTENCPKCSCAGARSCAPLMFIFSQKNHSQLLFTSLKRSIAGWLDYVLIHLVAWIWLAGFINENIFRIWDDSWWCELWISRCPTWSPLEQMETPQWQPSIRAGPATCNEELDSFFPSYFFCSFASVFWTGSTSNQCKDADHSFNTICCCLWNRSDVMGHDAVFTTLHVVVLVTGQW